MKTKIFGLFLSAALLICAGCEDKYHMYSENDDRLLFLFPADIENGSYSYHTEYTIDYTFVYNDLETDMVYLTVKTIGNVTDYPRAIKLEQVPFVDDEEEAPTALPDATPGVHYVAFGDAAYADLHIIPARKSSTQIPIIIKRDASLETSRVALRVRIAENEYFKLVYENRSQIDIFLTAQLSKPESWNWYVENRYFGVYGPVKHKFMIETTGEEINDKWFVDALGMAESWQNIADPGYGMYLARWLQGKLDVENERRAALSPPMGPLTEPAEYDGVEVTFMTDYYHTYFGI